MLKTIVTAKEFLQDIQKKFVKNEKIEISTLFICLISIKYSSKCNIREYITEMSHLVWKLNALIIVLSEKLLVHLVLISLPTQFNQFKVSYNYKMETQSLNKLILHCVKEEERLKQYHIETSHLISTTNNKSKGHKRKKHKEVTGMTPQRKQQKKSTDSEKENSYFFYGTEEF